MSRAAGPTEAELQRRVVALARSLGWGMPESSWRRQQEEAEAWSRLSGDGAALLAEAGELAGLVYHTRFSVGSESGWPDLLLLRRRDRRVMARELKSAAGRLTPRQSAVLSLLAACGVDAGVWRPADLESGRIEAELR